MKHRGTEDAEKSLSGITEVIIGAAIAVHRELGPGLLESVYEDCLSLELKNTDLLVERQKALPVVYKGNATDSNFRLDFLIEDQVVVELKAVEKILPIHEVQVVTYLRLSRKKLGLLLNFNVPVMKSGIRRIIL